MFPPLNFPEYQLQLRSRQQKNYIFDKVRKKYIHLSPEEWVRQHLIHFLLEELAVPMGLISIEKGLKVNKMSRRTDVLIHNRQGQAVFVAECKAPNIKLNAKVFEQIAAYNLSLNVKYLFVTNGLKHFVCEFDPSSTSFKFLSELPLYKDWS